MRLLFLLMIECFLHQVKGRQCSTTGTKGIAPCQCNFMDACDAQGNPKPNLAQYLPKGVDRFGFFEQGRRNLAYLCEGGNAVGILYDCNNRIPLYAATVINGPSYQERASGVDQALNFLKAPYSKRNFNKKMQITYALQSENFAINEKENNNNKTSTSSTRTG